MLEGKEALEKHVHVWFGDPDLKNTKMGQSIQEWTK